MAKAIETLSPTDQAIFLTAITDAGGLAGDTGATDNVILRSDGTDGDTAQASALVIDDATTSTQANVAIKNNHSETNSAIVLTPKGNGAFIVGPKPDGTTTGGNARGQYAVDLQPHDSTNTRGNANQVASGNYSFAAGQKSKATSDYSVAIGLENTSSGSASVAIGYLCNSSASQSVAMGSSCTASGGGSFAVGSACTASSTYSIALSHFAIANRPSMLSVGSYGFGSGNAPYQHILASASGRTTTNSAVNVANFAVASTKALNVFLHILGVSETTPTMTVASYTRRLTIENSNGTTAIVGSIDTIGTDQAAGTSISVTADDTNDRLKIECTGVLNEPWRWTVTISGAEGSSGY